MKISHFKYCLVVFAFSIFLACSESETSDQVPNILFIMSDDHAYQSISSYDGSLNQTPNIDRLAKEGVRFQNSFCKNSICGPSRAVMLTGKYSHANGHIDNNVTFDASHQTSPKLLHHKAPH